MKLKLLIFLVISTCVPLYAYEGKPKEQVEHFFRELQSGKISESIDHLYESNPLMAQKPQALTLLKQQLASVDKLYGKFLVNENVHYEEISMSLVRIVEVAKYEAHPVIWEFYFYKPKDKWMISQAMFADQFQNIEKKN